MRRIAASVACAVTLLWPQAVRAERAIFVVRHAEKATESNDPSVPLSAAGLARAQRLASLLKDAGIAAIYSTDYVRTRATVEPLAQALKLPVEIYPYKDAQGKPATGPLLDRLRRLGADDAVLVVGHSDNVPLILKALGCAEEVTIAGSEYDNLFIVVPRGSSPPLLLRLRY